MRAGVLVAICLAVPGCSISGKVTEAGAGLPGVTVRLGGDAQRTTTSGGDGGYRFTWLYLGNYRVTPTMAAYEVLPPFRSATIALQSVSGVDFTALRLAPFVAPVIGNLTATDLQNDGTFDTINTATPLEVRSTRVTYLNRYLTLRAALEFDLSAVSGSAPVRSAILQFHVLGLGNGGGGVPLDLHGYTGDGVLDLGDATAGGAPVASIVVSSAGMQQLDITAFVQQLVSSGSRIAGINIRSSKEALTSNVDDHCYIAGRQSTSTLFPGPRLTIAY